MSVVLLRNAIDLFAGYEYNDVSFIVSAAFVSMCCGWRVQYTMGVLPPRFAACDTTDVSHGLAGAKRMRAAMNRIRK
jgi:hypothetical protein